uniref:PH domain-containing protein n=1 Tax=Parastrongyloides trichosuri TaxID=131310 RepID=A0A0N5A2H3_PARTI
MEYEGMKSIMLTSPMKVVDKQAKEEDIIGLVKKLASRYSEDKVNIKEVSDDSKMDISSASEDEKDEVDDKQIGEEKHDEEKHNEEENNEEELEEEKLNDKRLVEKNVKDKIIDYKKLSGTTEEIIIDSSSSSASSQHENMTDSIEILDEKNKNSSEKLQSSLTEICESMKIQSSKATSVTTDNVFTLTLPSQKRSDTPSSSSYRDFSDIETICNNSSHLPHDELITKLVTEQGKQLGRTLKWENLQIVHKHGNTPNDHFIVFDTTKKLLAFVKKSDIPEEHMYKVEQLSKFI